MAADITGMHRGPNGAEGIDAIAAFADMPASLRRELELIRRVRFYRPGQVVLCEGDTPEEIGLVRDGILRMQKTLVTGRQHIVGLLVTGDIYGRVFDGPVHFDVEAATDAVVWSFARRPFEALLERTPELERMVLRNLLNELDRARDWMMILGNRKVTGRLAGFLLVLCTRFAEVEHLVDTERGVICVTVPISRADIAHLLGARQETISRAFHALADAGLIAIRSPQTFEIVDLDGLVAETGEDSALQLSALSRLRDRLGPRRA